MLLMYIVFVWEIRTSQGSEGLVDYLSLLTVTSAKKW